ncbi:hypothetical protein ACIBCS_19795 [Streptomyces phaeochromogenes]|uniref:VMAP-C domain-containing protein n=1 Tax=Streptomyces phaeochromogenes TaxID=1923 RepID=UPI0033CDFA47
MLPGHWGTREWAPPRLLLEALEQVRVLQDPQVLRDCIHWVESSLGVSLEVHEGPHRRVWLVNLLLALREHPRGLRALEGWIALLAPKTHDVSRLRVAIAVTEVPLLPAKDWERLLDLLRDVPSCDLGDAYEELFYGRGEPLSPDDADDPLFVVLHAATLNRVPGRPHPCVEMVARVAELAGGACAEGLRSWVEDHGGTGFNLEARHRTPWPPTHEQRGTGTGGTPLAAVPPFDELPVPPEKTESASGDLGQDVWSPGACLSIRIRHLADDAPESSRVLVSSWWQITHRGGLAFKGEDVLITEREAPGVVQALVEEAESGWAHRYQEDLALEFFLPEDLIHLPVERWPKLPFNGAEAALGEDHPVVVRSLDRLERPAIHGRWQQQWAIGLSTETGGRIHWFPGDGRGVIRTDPPAVVVLSSPPGPAAAPLGSHELAQALRAGAGVIIWDRREDPDPSFRDELTQILGRSDLRRLPAVVQTLRIRAWNGDAGEGSAVGCHLALLWDDPYRLPVAPGSGTVGTSPRRGSGHHAF